MTPRENMKAAIDFRCPERLPIQGYGENSDTFWLMPEDAKPAGTSPGCDQWSCRWERTHMANMGQVKGHPIASWDDYKTYCFPDVNDPRRYASVAQRLTELNAHPVNGPKYRITAIFMLLWERLQSLHGFENCMIDIVEDNSQIHELADRLTDYNIAFIKNMHRLCGSHIDAFNFSEDWGTETDLMMSPAHFRSFFLPRYKKIFKAAHDCGWHVWMHSCGKVNRAIPMLIEAGLNIINLQQPLALGIDEIGRDFAGKIAFESLCDIQKTLPKGDRAEIAAQAKQLVRQWGTPQGGFILGDYGDENAIGVDPSLKTFMRQSFQQNDPWKNGW